MQTNSKIKSLILTILIALFTVSAGLGIAMAVQNASAEEYKLEVSTEVSERYYVGDLLRVPSATITVGGNTVNADATVIYPNGSEMIADKISFDSVGIYTIKYKATVEGKVVEDVSTTFKVVDKLYSFDNPSCSAEITTYTFEEYNKSFTNSDVDGLWIDLPEGSTFTYNKVIDLSKNTALDEIIKFNVISSETGKADFGMLTIKLIDIYDENRFIKYEFYDVTANHDYSYVRGAGSNQGKCYSYAMGPKNTYGSLVYASKTNKTYQNWTSRADDTFTVGLDYATSKLYACKHQVSTGFNRMYEFCNLNSTSLFSDTWIGFTTGEVKLSIYPSNFAANGTTGSGVAHFLLREVDGQPITKVVDGVYSGVENYYVEDVPPKIDVDLGKYTLDTLPSAVVGWAYDVFPATAIDAGSGIKEFTTKVFFHYYDDPVKVDVKDGKFVPALSQPGLYTIEYKAVDKLGNEALKLVDIQCSSGSGYGITLADDGSTENVSGYEVRVKTPTVVNASGVASVEITAEGQDSQGKTVKYVIPTSTYKFIPLTSGNITVTYKATDYVGRVVTENDDIEVVMADKPVFLSEASFHKNFIQGLSYDIPMLEAKDFINDCNVTPKIEYKFGEDEWAVLNGTKLEIEVQDNNYTLYLKYTATSTSDALKFTEKEYEVPCLNINKTVDETTYYDRSKLFATGENVTASFEVLQEGAATEYATYTLDSDDSIEYINPLTAIDFSTLFAFTGGSFGSVKMIFTDVNDPDISVALTLSASGNSASVQATGGLLFVTSAMNFTKLGYQYKIEYDAANLAFKVADDGALYVIKNTLKGDVFEGFPSQKFYLKMEFEGVQPQSKIAITEINKFYLIDVQAYRQSATAKTLMNYDQSFIKDKVYNISRTIVLDPIVVDIKATLTIKTPSGGILKDVNGVAINNVVADQNYDVIFTEYGNYTVTYTIPGQSNIRKNIKVIDIQAPSLQIEKISSRYSVGDTVKIKAIADDDGGEESSVYISVYDALHTYTTLSNDTDYKFTKAGKYTFVFIAMDTEGNTSIIRKYVTVK